MNVTLSHQTLKYCSLKQHCGLSAAVVHSGLHARVMLKPSHCKTFCGYNGSFHSFQRKMTMTPAAAALHAGCSCSPTHPAAERQPRLMSALNALPASTSARIVCYSATGHCVQSLGLSSWLTALKKLGYPITQYALNRM